MRRALIGLSIAACAGWLIACDEETETTTEQEAVSATDEAEETPAEETAEAEVPEIPILTVEQVATLLESGDCVAVDANGASTREESGVVPDAVLLTSSGRYDPSAELPEDHATKLVFYCGGESCRAADGAADRALQAGYTDVNVMRGGISGWREAGNDTSEPPEA